MTTLFTDGFESGNFVYWTANYWSTIITNPVHSSGNYAIRQTDNYQRVEKTLPAGAAYNIRFFYMLETDLQPGDGQWIVFDATWGRAMAGVINEGSGTKWFIESTGRLCLLC